MFVQSPFFESHRMERLDGRIARHSTGDALPGFAEGWLVRRIDSRTWFEAINLITCTVQKDENSFQDSNSILTANSSWPINLPFTRFHQSIQQPSGSIGRGRKNQAGFGEDVDVLEPDGAFFMEVSEFGIHVADI